MTNIGQNADMGYALNKIGWTPTYMTKRWMKVYTLDETLDGGLHRLTKRWIEVYACRGDHWSPAPDTSHKHRGEGRYNRLKRATNGRPYGVVPHINILPHTNILPYINILPHTNIFHRQTKDKGCHKAWQPIFMSRDLCHVVTCDLCHMFPHPHPQPL